MSYTLSQKELLKEIKKREKQIAEELYSKFSIDSENGFWEFCKHMDSGFFVEEKYLLKELANILQDTAKGKYKKVSISIFPRAGKSYLVTMWCAWLLIYNPTGAIMRNTCKNELSETFSKDLRAMVGVPESGVVSEHHKRYLQVKPDSKLSKIDKSVTGWRLVNAKRYSYISASVGNSPIGKGCDIVAILDDVISKPSECTDMNLDNIWKWKATAHDTRIEGDCPEVMICTRWHEDDPIGRHIVFDGIVEEGGLWKVFSYPALIEKEIIDEKGNKKIEEVSICEAMISTAKLKEKKKQYINSGLEEEWNALYMQNPTVPKGRYFPKKELNYFKKKDLEYMGRPDEMLAYLDPADEGKDCLCLWIGLRYGMTVYLVDIIYTPEELNTALEERILSLVFTYGVHRFGVEGNNFGHRLAKFFRRKLRDRNSRTYVKEYKHQGSKLARINQYVGQIKEFFYFREDLLNEKEYKLAMKHLWGLRKDGGTRQKDDSADGCAGIAEMIGINQVVGGSDSLVF